MLSNRDSVVKDGYGHNLYWNTDLKRWVGKDRATRYEPDHAAEVARQMRGTVEPLEA